MKSVKLYLERELGSDADSAPEDGVQSRHEREASPVHCHLRGCPFGGVSENLRDYR